jgi:hypothetical protein
VEVDLTEAHVEPIRAALAGSVSRERLRALAAAYVQAHHGG